MGQGQRGEADRPFGMTSGSMTPTSGGAIRAARLGAARKQGGLWPLGTARWLPSTHPFDPVADFVCRVDAWAAQALDAGKPHPVGPDLLGLIIAQTGHAHRVVMAPKARPAQKSRSRSPAWLNVILGQPENLADWAPTTPSSSANMPPVTWRMCNTGSTDAN